MAIPEPSRDLEARVTSVEDAVQRFEFTHRVKTDAQSNGMGILYASQQRLEHMLVGFRAEVAAEFGAFRGEVEQRFAAVDARLESIESALAEVLRRLPEPDQPA